MFVIVNNVEGLVHGVYVRWDMKQALKQAEDLAREQCNSSREEIRKQLKADGTFCSPNNDIIVSIHEETLPFPQPTLRGGQVMDKNLRTVRVPLLVVFNSSPSEMEDREDEKKPSKKSLVEYLKDALVLDIDSEEYGQPDGAVFACSAVEWDKAEFFNG